MWRGRVARARSATRGVTRARTRLSALPLLPPKPPYPP
nr:MAG TPA: hypothetical protein [Caudoviricetes sp.]